MQSLRETDRFAVTVVGADVVAFGVLELLTDEGLGEFSLRDQFFEPRRRTIGERLAETALIVSSVSQNHRTPSATLCERLQHHIELALSPASVRRTIASSDLRPQGTSQP